MEFKIDDVIEYKFRDSTKPDYLLITEIAQGRVYVKVLSKNCAAAIEKTYIDGVWFDINDPCTDEMRILEGKEKLSAIMKS